MHPEHLFLILNYGVLLPWALMILAPNWRPAQVLITTIWVPVGLGLLYVLVMALAPMPPGGGDLPSIARLLGSSWGALAVWIHALAFDLFVGAWMIRDSQRRAIRHRWVAPCLALTLFLGPAGALAYLMLRLMKGGGTSMQEPSSTAVERPSV